MSQLVYRNAGNKDVCVKNPTDADMAVFWDDWSKRNGDAFNRELMARVEGSILFSQIAHTPRSTK